MANACFNPNDFQTDASGRLEINPAAVQNPAVIFSHTINGVFQAGTETMIATLNEGAQGSADEDVPALGQEATGSGSRLFQLTAGQQVRIMGAQDGNGSNDSRIVSNTKGRCRVTLVRLGTAA